MPGPAPKPNPLRTNKREVDWTDLPAGGNPNSAPAMPAGHGLRAHGKRTWEHIWSTPASTQWGDHERDVAVRYCQLSDIWQRDRDLKVVPEMRHCERELALTPKARKELRWRIVADGAVIEENGVRLAEPRRLRVVDDQAAV